MSCDSPGKLRSLVSAAGAPVSLVREPGNTVDANAIIGPHPHVPNLLLCNGFSGHGLQQSPGAGRAVAELITAGGYQTVDVSCFGFDRVLRGEPLYEQNIV